MIAIKNTLKKITQGLTFGLLLIVTIFSCLNCYLASRPLYYIAIALFVLIIGGCSIIVYADKNNPQKWDYIVTGLIIILNSCTPHPAIIVSPAILAYFVIRKFHRLRNLIIILVLAVAFTGISRIVTTKISLNEGKISFDPSEYICDVSTDGNKVLPQIIQIFGTNKHVIRYYITHRHGFFEQKYFLVTTDLPDEEHYFISNNRVIIQGNEYIV